MRVAKATISGGMVDFGEEVMADKSTSDAESFNCGMNILSIDKKDRRRIS